MSCLTIGAVISVSGLSLLIGRRNFHQELEQQAKIILDTLEVSSSNALYFQYFEEAGEVINGLDSEFKQNQLLTAARLYQTDGRIIADAFSLDQVSLNLEPDPLGQKILESDDLTLDWSTHELSAGKSIVVGGEIVGALSVSLSTSNLQQKSNETLVQGVLAAIAAAIVSIIFSHFLSQSITKPLHQLTEATEKIANRKRTQRIELNTHDELSVLADAFNSMSTQLIGLIESLEQKADELTKSRSIARDKASTLEETLQQLHQTQNQLIHQEKMSALGQMVAGVAHEINNPVSFIYGNLPHVAKYIDDLLSLLKLYETHYPNPDIEILEQTDILDIDFVKEDLERTLISMNTGVERIREIVLSLRNFSRMDEAEYKSVDIHEGLESTLMILQHRLKAQPERPEIIVVLDFDDLPAVECYAGQLNQVFMNIIASSIDALDSEMRKSSTFQKIPEITICTKTLAQHISISIADNGTGIPASVKGHIFDPFFTTKPVGKGTGMGLAISYQLVTERHDGRIECFSEAGVGTKFVIEIPIQSSASKQRLQAVH